MTVSKEKFYLYRFLDKNGEIIYIGRTRYLNQRLTNQHFTPDGHLDEQCYEETETIEFAEVATVNDQHIYEIHLIGRHRPKHNSQFKSDSQLQIELPELQWNKYVNEETTKRQYEKTLIKMEAAIDYFSSRIQGSLKVILDSTDDPEQIKRSVNAINLNLEYLANYKTAKIHIRKRKNLPPSF